MALIQCPECGKQISDKASACIHCGYPLDNKEEPKLYSMVFKGFDKNANRFLTKSILEQVFNIPKNTVSKLLQEEGSVLIDGVEAENIDYLKNSFLQYGCFVDFILSPNDYVNPQNQMWKKNKERHNKPVTCPHCGSNQITTGQRGFSMITGFIGSNKTVNRCAKCGYSWKPTK